MKFTFAAAAILATTYAALLEQTICDPNDPAQCIEVNWVVLKDCEIVHTHCYEVWDVDTGVTSDFCYEKCDT